MEAASILSWLTQHLFWGWNHYLPVKSHISCALCFNLFSRFVKDASNKKRIQLLLEGFFSSFQQSG